jgi:exoribonuclease R
VHHALIGERKRRTFRIGDNVRIRVQNADINSRTIDFVLIDSKSELKENE